MHHTATRSRPPSTAPPSVSPAAASERCMRRCGLLISQLVCRRALSGAAALRPFPSSSSSGGGASSSFVPSPTAPGRQLRVHSFAIAAAARHMADSEPAVKRAKLEETPAAPVDADNNNGGSSGGGGRRRRRPLSPVPVKDAPAGVQAQQAAAAAGADARQRPDQKQQPAAPAPAGPAEAAAVPLPVLDRQQQQPQQQQQQQQQQQGKKGKGKKQQQGRSQHLGQFHQCVKREMSHAALHVYGMMKAEAAAKLDLMSVCSGLLNVAVGNWQWELHLRHQHLLRQHAAGGGAAGSSAQQLQEAFDVCLAAERGRLMRMHEAEKQQQQQQQNADAEGGAAAADELSVLPNLPPGMQCQILRFQTDKVIQPEALHSTEGLEDVLANMPADPLPLAELLPRVSSLVVADLAAAGLQPDETVLCQLARVAAITGDADKAFAYGRQCVEAHAQRGGGGGKAGAPPRLRDFHPALVSYALQGRAEAAGSVIQAMLEHCEPGDLTESEYALWLEAIANGGSYAQLESCLGRMAGDLNQLRPTTLALVQAFFGSDRAASALRGSGPLAAVGGRAWQQEWVVPDDSGHVAEAGVTLELQDLSPADWAAFDAQLFGKAKAAEAKPGQFTAFRAWLDAHGPFDLTIDGANLAFWGENYAGGGFRAHKVRTAYTTLQAAHPRSKILLVLHEGRYRETWDADPETGAWMDGLCASRRMYRTPPRMNDDLFWMYATIHAGEAGRLVSNDQMRDHVWSMLRPKHMLKWKERHVVRYAFNFPKTVFTARPPCAYTPCVQQRAPGVWLLPSGDKRWLLCRPSGSSRSS